VADVSIRELRNHGGEVVGRATRGEQTTINRSRPALSAEVLLSRWQQLPAVDPAALRADVHDLLAGRW
jgi:hypothetical protein